MIDKKKIRIMTAMAIYDKYYGDKDRKIDGHYRADYIYKKNSFTRLSVLTGIIILCGIYAINLIFNGNFDITEFNYIYEAEIFGVALVGILILYTIISSHIYGKEYDDAQQRLENYSYLMDMLKNLNSDKCGRK